MVNSVNFAFGLNTAVTVSYLEASCKNLTIILVGDLDFL